MQWKITKKKSRKNDKWKQGSYQEAHFPSPLLFRDGYNQVNKTILYYRMDKGNMAFLISFMFP